jgi:hypothetical protein
MSIKVFKYFDDTVLFLFAFDMFLFRSLIPMLVEPGFVHS